MVNKYVFLESTPTDVYEAILRSDILSTLRIGLGMLANCLETNHVPTLETTPC